jgi:hypothetical protein
MRSLNVNFSHLKGVVVGLFSFVSVSVTHVRLMSSLSTADCTAFNDIHLRKVAKMSDGSCAPNNLRALAMVRLRKFRKICFVICNAMLIKKRAWGVKEWLVDGPS